MWLLNNYENGYIQVKRESKMKIMVILKIH